VGSVFSPYYALTGRKDPENHCALNVAVYQPRSRSDPRGNRWAMTERGRNDVTRTSERIQIGPSQMRWEGGRLVVEFDERSFPIPGRIRGTITIEPRTISQRMFALDTHCRHQWWPIGPRARISVDLDSPRLTWTGTGYLDANLGSEPLESAFENWNWSRATVGDEAIILYDITRRGGDRAALALRVDADGNVGAMELPETQSLPQTAIWRVARQTQSEGGCRLVRTLEDTPFYSRSQIRNVLLGQETDAMHESLALGRLRSPIVKSLLPWRMPRACWPVRADRT